MEDLKTPTRKKSSKKKKVTTETTIHSPHDRFFKTAMSDIRVAQAFFEHYLPTTLRPSVDLNSLELCQNSYIDPTLDLSSSDVLYKATIAGETGYLYLLCEHQSSVDRLMPFRIWEYIVSIWRDHLKQTQQKTLPLVVPLVFYHGARPYNGAKDIRDLIKAPQALIDEILFKQFHLIDMHHITDETLREQRWVGIMAFVMKHVCKRECMTFIQPFITMLRHLTQEYRATDYISALLNYFSEAGNTEQPKAVADLLREGLSNSEDGIMSIADKWVEMGRQTGESNVLLQLLECKFGVIPLVYKKRVQAADSTQLIHWVKQALEAQTLETVFKNN